MKKSYFHHRHKDRQKSLHRSPPYNLHRWAKKELPLTQNGFFARLYKSHPGVHFAFRCLQGKDVSTLDLKSDPDVTKTANCFMDVSIY